MAILQPVNISWKDNPYEVSVKEHAIGGKLVQVSHTLSEFHATRMVTVELLESIKEQIAKSLVEYLIEQNFVEFTYQTDYYTQKTVVRARCFLTPNEQVKILRTHDNHSK